MIGGTLPTQKKARRIMTKIVNLLSAKAEMGSPMICMYLLGNPDHYTSHTFVPFYWQSFVTSVWKSGLVRFFGQISTDRNRNRLPIMARPQITGLDRK